VRGGGGRAVLGGADACGVGDAEWPPATGAPPTLPKLPDWFGGACLICWIDRGAYSAIDGGDALSVVIANVAISRSKTTVAEV
jgi:hypothetical protein